MRKELSRNEVTKLEKSLDHLDELISEDFGYPVRFLIVESKNWRKEQSIILE
ncbi:hypothetical protein LCGC14_1568090, partial [marine sediment metagenome]